MPTQMAARTVPRAGPSEMIVARLHSIVSGLVWTFATWCARRAERLVLRDLAQEPHFLSDIGLSREQALREASKPFWRP